MSLRRIQRFKRTLVSAVTRAVVRAIGEGKRATAAVAGPAVTGGQSFSYVENKTAGYNIGTVLATDPVAITQFRFAATGTGTSSDGWFAISSGGVITLTAAGALSTANDYDDAGGGAANTFTPTIQAGNASAVWSTPVAVTINVLDVDDTAPVVAPSQTINFVEGQASGAVIGSVAATDNVGVTGYRFTATGTSTSSDTFFSISSAGVVTMTVAGAAGSMNDYDDGVTNSAVHSVQAGDAAGNWSTGVNVTFNVTNSTADDVSMLVGMNMGPATYFTPNQPFANIMWQGVAFRRTDDSSDAIWPTQDQGLISGATGTMTFYSTLIVGSAGIPSQTFRFKNPDGNQLGFGTGSGSANIVSLAAGAAATSAYIDVPYTAGTDLVLHAKGNVTNTAGTFAGAPRLLLPGHETSYDGGNYFNSAALSFHTGLGTRSIRCMDWVGANSTVQEVWADRTTLAGMFFRNPTGAGVPWEICISLANRLNADLYVNVPPRATSAYVTSLMALIAAQLNVGLKIYVERGNELWNTFGVFASNHNWVDYLDHTKFSLSISGSTITKTAHGYVDGDALITWETAQALNLGWDANTAFGAGYTQYYKLAYGGVTFVKVLTANTFQLWDGPGGTGNLCVAPTGVTSLIGAFVNEAGKTPDSLAHTGELSISDWTIADAALGSSRVKAVIPSWAAVPFTTTTILTKTPTAATRANHVAIAPYHDGFVWGGQVDRTTTTFTPKFWSNGNGTFHYSVYASGSTPTLTQRKAGTGTGFLYHKSLAYTTVDNVYTADTTATGFTNGTSYEHWIDYVDSDGYTWSVHQTIAAGAASSTDFLDTFANQSLRNALDFDRADDSGVIQQILDHKAAAIAINSAITMINYEGGSHQDTHPPSAIATWFESYRESSTYGDNLKHYYNCIAAAGCRVHNHYMDIGGNPTNVTPWRIANDYTDTTDQRYLAIASFAGLVPVRTLVDSGTVTGTSFASAPTYPAAVATFADATWTYSVASKGADDGNYSITGNVLSLTGTGSINFATNATQTVYIYATDGNTDTYFPVQFNTGPVTWYSLSSTDAWSAVDDTTPAAMNLYVGNSLALTGTAATVVSDGWDLNGVATYSGGHGNGNIPYTSNPLFLFVGRTSGDTSNFTQIAQFGTSPQVLFYTLGSATMNMDNGATGTIGISVDNTLSVYWLYFDNTNLKFYYGKNQTVTNSGGTTYSSQGAATFGDFVQIGGGTTSWVIAGHEVAPASNLTAALALVQAAQTKHGI